MLFVTEILSEDSTKEVVHSCPSGLGGKVADDRGVGNGAFQETHGHIADLFATTMFLRILGRCTSPKSLTPVVFSRLSVSSLVNLSRRSRPLSVTWVPPRSSLWSLVNPLR